MSNPVSQTNNTRQDDNSDESNSQYVRITQGGKIKKWVEFSLKFFEENPERPLVLHTLRTNPAGNKTTAQPGSSSNPLDEVDGEEADETSPAHESTKNGEQRKPPDSISSQTIPKLISVVEIIKREYSKRFVKGGEVGLYQYNYLGTIGDSEDWVGVGCASHNEGVRENGPGGNEDERMQEILSVLSGKNHLRIQKAPYMKTILCTTSLPQLESNPSYTSQHPNVKKIPKPRSRKRKRGREKDKMDTEEDRVDVVTGTVKRSKLNVKESVKAKGSKANAKVRGERKV